MGKQLPVYRQNLFFSAVLTGSTTTGTLLLDSFDLRMCFLSIRNAKIVCKGSKSPKSGTVGKSQPKGKRSKVPYNSVIKRNQPMVVVKHLKCICSF